MKFGINGMSTIGLMSNNFEETVLKLKDGGVDYIEAMSDWGAKSETIQYITKQTGNSGWDSENALVRLEYLRSIGMDIR